MWSGGAHGPSAHHAHRPAPPCRSHRPTGPPAACPPRLRVGDDDFGALVGQHRLQGAQEAGALALHKLGVGAAAAGGYVRVGRDGVNRAGQAASRQTMFSQPAGQCSQLLVALGSFQDESEREFGGGGQMPTAAATPVHPGHTRLGPMPPPPTHLRACARFMR